MTEPAALETTPDTGVAEHFRHIAALHPGVPALTAGPLTWTYADIDRWSDAIAADIAACGAPPERPVAVVTRDNILVVPAALGAIKGGHYFLTVDAGDPDERIELILRESTATLCLADATGDLPPAVRRRLVVPIRPLPADAVAPPAREKNPYLHVVFTSGTTGAPKAIRALQYGFVQRIQRTHGAMVGERRNWTAVPGFTRAATHVLNVLLTGQTLCAFDARRESLDEFARWLKRERVDHVSMTPSYFRRLMALPPEDVDLAHVRSLSLNADKVTPADVELFRSRFPRGARLLCGYAASETAFVFRTVITHDTPPPGPLVPMGTPVPGVEVRLVDDEGNDVPGGETGELVVRGADVVEGYWNDAALTAERFRADPADPGVRTFFTGDLARRGADGMYYFMGRKDERVKIHGRRIDPLEVEAALIATGEVRDAAVVGKAEENGDTRLVAYVVMRDGRPCDPRAIRVKLRESHPAWMVPVRIFELDAVPMTRAMKVDRQALLSRADPVNEPESAAGDELERQLVAIWSEVIGAPVRVDDDFFDDHGGESVVAAHLASAVERATGAKLHLSQLLELSSVRKMAEFVRASRRNG